AQELHVQTVDDLRAALEAGQVASLPRVGEKIQTAILQELQRIETRSQRLPLAIALPAAEEVIGALRRCSAVGEIVPAGSIRRWRETTGDIDVLVSSAPDLQREVIETFTTLPAVKQVLSAGETRASVLTHADVQIDLRVVPGASFGAALQYFTG